MTGGVFSQAHADTSHSSQRNLGRYAAALNKQRRRHATAATSPSDMRSHWAILGREHACGSRPVLPERRAPRQLQDAAEKRQRFDVVSWDPRGVGESTAVQCFASAQAEAGFLGDAVNFPVGPAQKRSYIATWRAFGRRCAARHGALLRYVSTVDSARDLDRLRQAIGAPQLTYWGLSYGTILGATYANIFPSRVRALVLDGNIAPSAWTATATRGRSLSISLRIGSDVGAARNLHGFLSLCGRASVTRCAFSAGSAGATTAKFTTLLARLKARAVTIGGKTITYAFILGQLANGGLDITQPFQDPRLPPTAGSTGWAGVAQALEKLWTLTSPPPALAASTASAASAASSEAAVADLGGRYAGPEQGMAVTCGDTENPRNPQRYAVLEPLVLRRAGPVGLPALWGDETCATWPARAIDTYRGPWNRRTANPILVVGNTADPATPHAGSVAMAAQLARARLLTVQGFGHTELLNPSSCASRYITSYLLRQALPPAHTICRQDR